MNFISWLQKLGLSQNAGLRYRRFAVDCRYCEHMVRLSDKRVATCKFGLRPETCGRFELAECYKALVKEEARLGCEYGTYCDGEDRVFYPEGAKIEK